MSVRLAWFDRRRAEQLRAMATINPPVARMLEELGALYLFGTIGMEAVLLPDGSVLVAVDERWDEPQAPLPEWRRATETERTLSLMIARKRLPEVADLLPQRPPRVPDCPQCGGSGFLLGDAIACGNCGALGWLQPNVAT